MANKDNVLGMIGDENFDEHWWSRFAVFEQPLVVEEVEAFLENLDEILQAEHSWAEPVHLKHNLFYFYLLDIGLYYLNGIFEALK